MLLLAMLLLLLGLVGLVLPIVPGLPLLFAAALLCAARHPGLRRRLWAQPPAARALGFATALGARLRAAAVRAAATVERRRNRRRAT